MDQIPNPLVSSYGCAYSRDSGQYACVVSDPPRSHSVFLHLIYANRNAKVKRDLYKTIRKSSELAPQAVVQRQSGMSIVRLTGVAVESTITPVNTTDHSW